MEESVRERGVLPIFVPLGIFAVIGILVFSFSRILLNVPRQVAVAVALMTALNILVTCYTISVRKVQGFTALLLVVVIAVPVVVGGAAASKIIKVKLPAEPVAIRTIQLSAKGTAFSLAALDLTAPETKIDFKNGDTVPHNVHIFNGPDAKSPTLFTGSIVPGGSSTTYDVTGLSAGTYYFRCDIHPTQMTGTVTVKAAGTAPSASGTESAGPLTSPISLGAANTAFTKHDFAMAANTPYVISFHNGDSVVHNFHIVSGPAGFTPAATAPALAQPGATVTYDIPALPAGTYQYQCDVHAAQMKGTITVQ